MYFSWDLKLIYFIKKKRKYFTPREYTREREKKTKQNSYTDPVLFTQITNHLHITRRTAIQQAVAVVDTTERRSRSDSPAAAAGLVIMRVEMTARGTAENRVRLSAAYCAGDTAVQRRTDFAVVMIRPRFFQNSATAAVQVQRIRGTLRKSATHAH